MKKVKLLQTKSPIGWKKFQVANLRSLKLGKIGSSSVFEDTPSFRGRLKVIRHLVEVVDDFKSE